MLNIVLILGLMPLILGLDINAIARAVGIATALPTIIILWSVTRIPKIFPEAYAKADFTLNRFWIWVLFILSTISVVIGVIILAQGLTVPVLVTLLIWVLISVGYYPVRRTQMKRKGVDLDLTTRDLSIFSDSPTSR
jgi:APA family basic amino acid/polyamine antiporter